MSRTTRTRRNTTGDIDNNRVPAAINPILPLADRNEEINSSSTDVRILAAVQVDPLSGLSHEQILEWELAITKAHLLEKTHTVTLVNEVFRSQIERDVSYDGITIQGKSTWKDWTYRELISTLKVLYPREENDEGNPIISIEKELKELKLILNPMKPSLVVGYVTRVHKVFSEHSQKLEDWTAESSKVVIDAIKFKLKHQSVNPQFGKQMHDVMVAAEIEDNKFKTLGFFLDRLTAECKKHLEYFKFASNCGMVFQRQEQETDRSKRKNLHDPTSTVQKKQKGNDTTSTSATQPQLVTVATPNNYPTCKGCGKRHSSECIYKTHPCFNNSVKDWANSEIGKKLEAKGLSSLHPHKQLVGGEVVDFEWKLNSTSTFNFISHDENNKNVILPIRAQSQIQSMVLKPGSKKLPQENCVTIVDSGAIAANYINASYVEYLLAHSFDVKIKNIKQERVTSAFSESLTNKSVILNLILFNDRTKYILYNEEYKIVEALPVDILVGLPCIRKHDLTKIFRVHFVNEKVNSEGLEGTSTGVATSKTPVNDPTSEGARLFPMGAITVNKNDLLDTEYDDDEIEQYFKQAPWDTSQNIPIQTNSEETTYKIFGDENLKQKLQGFLDNNKSRFSTTVGKHSADIPPYEMEVDKDKWEKPSNRTPLRPQTAAKMAATQKFIRQAIADRIIVPSQAPYWSQLLLTNKPNGTFRICLDYRNLNNCMKSKGFPLPNIASMLQRIGSQKGKYYAVLDLTSGYHQAPVSVDSQDFTTFITSEGLYKWTRVPMGPKSAPSYFQQHMTTTVLAGLVHVILEVYLDDIIIYAKTQDELLERLKIVFDRLEKFNITLNPDKCKFGMDKVEYVGHTIDETGLHFSDEKLEGVANFPIPTTHKQLKSFLGLISYFRDHIENHSTLVHDLQQMITSYCKNKKLVWTEQNTQLFFQIRDKVANCPKLFFVDEHSPIVLCTDASNYGIGAYLHQIVDGKEQPIAFISKSLTSKQLEWSTIEKEAYAIFFAFQKLEHLIRDTKFLLKTDHENLTFINTCSKEKVRRWKIAIQEYDFDIEHIKGVENIAADVFSRLCPYPEGTTEEEINFLFPMEQEISIPQKCYKKISTVHNSHIGHSGFEKTIQRLNECNEHWPERAQHVKSFLRKCPYCQKSAQIKIPIITNPYTVASYGLMDRINVDTIGPLPPDEHGNKYIVVIIDCFSRFIELYPAEDTKAVSAAKAVMHFAGRYGIPAQILSDNGTQFANSIMKEMEQLFGYEHKFTHPYSHEENAIVERANKEVMRHLDAIIFDTRTISQWFNYLPLVQRIINSQIHESIGVSPASLVFGNTLTLDRGILFPHKPNEIQKLSQWTSNMLEAQEIIISTAIATQNKKDMFHIANNSGLTTEFATNSYVLVKYENDEHRPPTKFHTKLRGPLRVVNHVGPIYTCENLVTNKLEDFHIKLLSPFHFDAANTSPADIANRDNQNFIVKSILKHKFVKYKSKKSSDLAFLTLWEDDTQSWTSFHELRNNIQLHKYLKSKKMETYIPKQFKNNLLSLVSDLC